MNYCGEPNLSFVLNFTSNNLLFLIKLISCISRLLVFSLKSRIKCAALLKCLDHIERIIVLALLLLQDDVIGASSELSLSCISLSGE